MAQQIPKRHHVIPKLLLRNFTEVKRPGNPGGSRVPCKQLGSLSPNWKPNPEQSQNSCGEFDASSDGAETHRELGTGRHRHPANEADFIPINNR